MRFDETISSLHNPSEVTVECYWEEPDFACDIISIRMNDEDKNLSRTVRIPLKDVKKLIDALKEAKSQMYYILRKQKRD